MEGKERVRRCFRRLHPVRTGSSDQGMEGLVLIAMGTSRFVAAGTNIPPNLPTTTLVVDGIYGRTRNPLYLGATLIYLGLSVAAGSLWAIMLVVHAVADQCGRDCAGRALPGA